MGRVQTTSIYHYYLKNKPLLYNQITVNVTLTVTSQ